ncbi:MAG: ribonuclease P protein component [Chloroflexota bacterium]
MLPQRHRLRRSADIRRVRRHGRRWRHPLLLLFTATNSQETSRFAISASRRVGKAVVRNKARRRVREAIRTQLPRMQPGYDCVFVVRDSLPAASFADVNSAVCQLLQQAGLLD